MYTFKIYVMTNIVGWLLFVAHLWHDLSLQMNRTIGVFEMYFDMYICKVFSRNILYML